MIGLFMLLLSSVTAVDEAVCGLRGGEDPIFQVPKGLARVEMSVEDQTLLRFVSDFATRSEWDHVVIFVPVSSALLKLHASVIYTYLNGRGRYVSIHSTENSLVPQSLLHNRHRLGIVLVWDSDVDVFFNKTSESEVFNGYQLWLFIGGGSRSGANISQKLRELNLGLESNAVICRIESRPIVHSTKPPRSSSTEITETNEGQYYEIGDPICVADNQNEKWFREICITESGLPRRIKRHIAAEPQALISLYQMYKISKTNNTSFTELYLGLWDPANGLTNVRNLVPVEKRFDLRGGKIIVGVRNSTTEVGVLPAKTVLSESDEDEELHMKEILECFTYGLNASREIMHYLKLGWRNEEGGWTHMLGAVVDGAIDFALDTISVNLDTNQEMYQTHPIVKAMKNIYFKRPDSGGMRNIFLAPFSPKLLLSVFITGISLALAMIAVNFATVKLMGLEKRSINETEAGVRGKRVEVGEAAIWTISVICMQGSPWHPTSKSGSLLLICSLLFSLVIYNAYAAFITSVLSVTNMRIKTVEDLINSNFAFGYTLGNTDELFLRTVNDSHLRELYFKGLRENNGVHDPIRGMQKASKGNYAFFVAARTARRSLRREVVHRERCGIQELALPVTKTVAAIPMSRQSQFKKIINFRILRMMESGILHRFQRLILPAMPKCVEKTAFNSARFTDVYTAFCVLSTGWVTSGILLVAEIFWYKRKDIWKKLKRGSIVEIPGGKPFKMYDSNRMT